MTSIKICGFTREADVRMAVRLGVDYLGLNFVFSSPRRIEADRAHELATTARDEAARAGVAAPTIVGVFAYHGGAEIEGLALRCGLDVAQLHGEAAGDVAASLRMPSIRAWRCSAGETRPRVSDLPAWAHLLDGCPPGSLGGSGQRCDWNLARDLANECRLFLAGGLTPENVAGALRVVAPFAVDVASGVESSPGVKDERAMARFVEEVRRHDRSA